MDLKRVIARNAVWNVAGLGTMMLAGFVVAPFLIHRLGETSYGLWVLIGSLTSYFGLLDLGVRGSVGRYIAFHRAQEDEEGVNATLNTALVVLSVVAAVALLSTLGMTLIFFRLFDVPDDQVADVRLALILVGLNLALSFPLTLFDATLWAFQRFDVINAIDIPGAVLRTVLTFALIGGDGGLVTLALLTLGSALLIGAAKAVMSFRLDRGLRLAPSLARRAMAWKLYNYGLWYFLLGMSLMLSGQLSVLIIGAWVSVQLVTSYSVASRLVGCANGLLIACTGVLTPVATAFEAEQDQGRQQRLFLHGGTICTALALYFAAIFLLLGKPLIVLWLGNDIDNASRWLTILVLGQVLPLSQWVTYSMILAMGRHRFTACVSLVEVGVASGLALLWVGPYGLAGICVAFALCSTLSRGLIQMMYGCHLVKMSPSYYAAQALLLPALASAIPVAVLALLVSARPADGWMLFLGQIAVFTSLYLAAASLVLVPWQVLRSHTSTAKHALRRLGRFRAEKVT